ncbi:unnamed protein product, partial [Ectocarpus sp. 12 AP-2014]
LLSLPEYLERNTSAVQCVKGREHARFSSCFGRDVACQQFQTRSLPSVDADTGHTVVFAADTNYSSTRQHAVSSVAPERTCQETARSKSTTAVAAVAVGLEQSVR